MLIGVMMPKRSLKVDTGSVLRVLTNHGGSMGKVIWLARVHMRLIELEAVLLELERAGKVKLTDINHKLVVGVARKQMINSGLSHLSEKRSRMRCHLVRKGLKRKAVAVLEEWIR